jgi:hypothetical protein
MAAAAPLRLNFPPGCSILWLYSLCAVILIEELQNSKPIEPSFVSIKEYGEGNRDFGAKVTPLQLASALERDNQQALKIVQQVATADETLRCEIADVQAWAHLGLYFAKKIRTAVALNQNDKPAAIAHITEAQKHWRDLVAVTEAHIQPSHLAITDQNFHWKNYQENVDAELASVRDR